MGLTTVPLSQTDVVHAGKSKINCLSLFILPSSAQLLEVFSPANKALLVYRWSLMQPRAGERFCLCDPLLPHLLFLFHGTKKGPVIDRAFHPQELGDKVSSGSGLTLEVDLLLFDQAIQGGTDLGRTTADMVLDLRH